MRFFLVNKGIKWKIWKNREKGLGFETHSTKTNSCFWMLITVTESHLTIIPRYTWHKLFATDMFLHLCMPSSGFANRIRLTFPGRSDFFEVWFIYCFLIITHPHPRNFSFLLSWPPLLRENQIFFLDIISHFFSIFLILTLLQWCCRFILKYWYQ